jgi:hypothetical protein
MGLTRGLLATLVADTAPPQRHGLQHVQSDDRPRASGRKRDRGRIVGCYRTKRDVSRRHRLTALAVLGLLTLRRSRSGGSSDRISAVGDVSHRIGVTADVYTIAFKACRIFHVIGEGRHSSSYKVCCNKFPTFPGRGSYRLLDTKPCFREAQGAIRRGAPRPRPQPVDCLAPANLKSGGRMTALPKCI